MRGAGLQVDQHEATSKDGTKIPGTTTIIGRFKESGGLLQWAFKQGKAGKAHLYEEAEKAADIARQTQLTAQTISLILKRLEADGLLLRGEPVRGKVGQPSVPLPLTAAQRRDPGISEAEMKVIERRAADEGLCALGLRFSGDPLVPAERFKTLKDRLGDAFEVIEIDSSPGNAGGFGRMAHSVLTLEVREQEGQQAYEARRRVVEFFKERLT